MLKGVYKGTETPKKGIRVLLGILEAAWALWHKQVADSSGSVAKVTLAPLRRFTWTEIDMKGTLGLGFVLRRISESASFFNLNPAGSGLRALNHVIPESPLYWMGLGFGETLKP